MTRVWPVPDDESITCPWRREYDLSLMTSVWPVPDDETAHPSTASVPITALLYDGPMSCGFNVAIKGLSDEKITA